MEMFMLTAISLLILGLAVFAPVPAGEGMPQRIDRPAVSTVARAAPLVVQAPPPMPPPSAAVAEIAADFAWANNQTVFVIACRTRRMAVAVGPPGGRA